jgi:hypothetical protein
MAGFNAGGVAERYPPGYRNVRYRTVTRFRCLPTGFGPSSKPAVDRVRSSGGGNLGVGEADAFGDSAVRHAAVDHRPDLPTHGVRQRSGALRYPDRPHHSRQPIAHTSPNPLYLPEKARSRMRGGISTVVSERFGMFQECAPPVNITSQRPSWELRFRPPSISSAPCGGTCPRRRFRRVHRRIGRRPTSPIQRSPLPRPRYRRGSSFGRADF